PPPGQPGSLDPEVGRGLVLIRAFMDEVTFNATGNEITLVKRRESAASPPPPGGAGAKRLGFWRQGSRWQEIQATRIWTGTATVRSNKSEASGTDIQRK